MPACRKPSLEALEDRVLMSGNVIAALSGGVLTITGDSGNNVITLTEVGNKVTITPDATTKINKALAGAAVDILGVTGAIKINETGAGNDSVTIAGQAIGGVATPFSVGNGNADLTINLGAGNDRLLIEGGLARNVAITTGKGNNAITITGLNPDGAAGGPADVRTVINGNLSVTGKAGNDTIVLRGIKVGGNVSLPVGQGGNYALITPYAGSDANFDVTIGGSFSYDSSLAFKSNYVTFDDPANVGAIHIGGSVTILLGLMDDAALVTPAAHLTVGGSMFINGCMGNDTLSVNSAKIGTLLIINGDFGNNIDNATNVTTGVATWIDGHLILSSSIASKLPAGWNLSQLSGLTSLLSQFGVTSLSGLSLPSWLTPILSSMTGLNLSSLTGLCNLGISTSTLSTLSKLSGLSGNCSSTVASLLSKLSGLSIKF